MRLSAVTLPHEWLAVTTPTAVRSWLEALLKFHGRRFYIADALHCGCIRVECMDADQFQHRLAVAEWANRSEQGEHMH